VIANIDTGNQLPDFQPYVFTALDSTLTAWSGPTALGIGADYIDTYVAKLGTAYHAFIKSETTRYLEHATAPSLTGPWTFVGKDNWAGWGSEWKDRPSSNWMTAPTRCTWIHNPVELLAST